jgi:peptide-methionine (R)-S-oxide reductase
MSKHEQRDPVGPHCGTLNPEQHRVLREHGTEAPHSSPLEGEQRSGLYHCVGCGAALFGSGTKYHSGSGWPSFFSPLDGALASHADRSHGMLRTEVRCARCDGHLGHVFPDGPAPTGLRYCINGVALRFEPAAQ